LSGASFFAHTDGRSDEKMPTYDIKQFSPEYGGMIKSDGEVANVADVVAKFESLVSITNIVAITPNDSTNLANATKAIYVSEISTVKIDTINDQTITLSNLAAGVWHPIQAKKIYSTGTVATGLLGSW
jgi:AAA+ ATPase superfamily predicted ATPase